MRVRSAAPTSSRAWRATCANCAGRWS